MGSHKRPPQLTPRQTEALLDKIGIILQPKTPDQPTQARQQSYYGWTWDPADPHADPYAQTG